jgi:hypothetical protein
MRWVVGTGRGLVGSDGEAWLAGREITALAWDGGGWLALVDGHEMARAHGDEVDLRGSLPEETGRCILPLEDGALVGTANARLALVREGGGVTMLDRFDAAEGRAAWYTPWGGPPDTRSLARSTDGLLFANVHVGGILRASQPEGLWEPTIDIDADVHQVLSDPLDPAHVVAATALGLAESVDAGQSWRFSTDGLHAPYARAVALDGGRLFLSASTGPRGGRAAVYRRDPGGEAFVRCDGSLPEWFAGNVDSHCLAAGGRTAIFGTEDGRAFLSEDAGGSWRQVLDGEGRISCVGVAASEGPGP